MHYFYLFYSYAVHRYLHFSLHDALPILLVAGSGSVDRDEVVAGIPIFAQIAAGLADQGFMVQRSEFRDRKSTRLNSSHVEISYAVFCLKKKKARAASATGRRTPAAARAT